jgi:hypothetical protein
VTLLQDNGGLLLAHVHGHDVAARKLHLCRVSSTSIAEQTVPDHYRCTVRSAPPSDISDVGYFPAWSRARRVGNLQRIV